MNVDQSDEDGSPGATGAVSAEGGAAGGNVDHAAAVPASGSQQGAGESAGATGGGPSGVSDGGEQEVGVGVGHEHEQESESDWEDEGGSAAKRQRKSAAGAAAGAGSGMVAASTRVSLGTCWLFFLYACDCRQHGLYEHQSIVCLMYVILNARRFMRVLVLVLAVYTEEARVRPPRLHQAAALRRGW